MNRYCVYNYSTRIGFGSVADGNGKTVWLTNLSRNQ